MQKKKSNFKRMFFDIETSPNVVLSFNIGHNISINHDNIIQERAIICICWKWQGDKKIYSLNWDANKDDKQMLIDFVSECEKADEIIGHNGDGYDIPWLRTRCLYHDIKITPDFQSIDTLKISRKKFMFNSNKLDYLAQFLCKKKKTETGGFALWKDIVLNNNKSSLDKMVKYCKNDVAILEEVYDKLYPFIDAKSHIGASIGGSKKSCPHCGSEDVKLYKTRFTAYGYVRRQMICNPCNKYFTIPDSSFE